MSRTNYIFVDFENVQATELDRIANKPVKVIYVLGERHKNLPVKFVKLLLKYAGQVNLVETGRTGRNALDLVLSSQIGEVKRTDPRGYFHIVSRDKDFDALIGHLKDEGMLAARHASFGEIPVLMDLEERVKLLAKFYRENQTGRPTKRTKLGSQIQTIFGKALSPAEVEETVRALVTAKVISISAKDEVKYAGQL